ncbi:MAG: GNAT family N-acetyltransferase [Proteobacteria bacterium]|nr:GNAT family N-acetyltransferase [Pseudomonadota bacterium]
MTDSKPVRYWMKIATVALSLSAENDCRNISMADAEGLGGLMHVSYLGTIDFAGETAEQSIDETKGMLTGKYGDFLDFASFLIEKDGEIQSASIITLYHGKPLLADILTKPDAQGKGLAGRLIQRSIDALAAAGYRELYLVVTEGNPAEALYLKLGFGKLGPATPRQPPPAPC